MVKSNGFFTSACSSTTQQHLHSSPLPPWNSLLSWLFVATFSGIFPLPCSFSNCACWFLISYLNPICWNTSEFNLEQSFLYLYTLRVCVSQSCPTLCDTMDCSPPHSSIQGILQAIILEWVAIPFSKKSSQPKDQTWVSCIAGRFFTVWATREAPLVS